MKKLHTHFLNFILSFIVTGTLFAQSELPKFASSPDKVKVKLDFPLEGRAYKNGTGYALNPKMISELPRKVALVSYYTFDPGFTRSYSTSSTVGNIKTTRTVTKMRNAGGNAAPIALGFYYEGIDILKEKYKEMGMELLEPEEFLDTEDKKEFYANYQVEKSKFNEILQNMLNSGGDHSSVYAYPDNYKLISVDNEPFANYEKKGLFPVYKSEVNDAQLWVMEKIGKEVTSLNTLTEALGVDAIVFVYSTIYVPKESEIHLQNVNMLMFGKNPTQLEEGKKKMNYFPGQMYFGARVNVGVPILKVNKKKPETNELSFDGYGNIIESMTIAMKEYFDKKMN